MCISTEKDGFCVSLPSRILDPSMPQSSPDSFAPIFRGSDIELDDAIGLCMLPHPFRCLTRGRNSHNFSALFGHIPFKVLVMRWSV